MVAAIAVALALAGGGDLTSADCARTPKLLAAWAQIGASLRAKDFAAAKAGAQAIASVCADADAGGSARVVLANLALSDGETDHVLDILKPLADPLPGPMGAVAAWLRLQAYEVRNDAAGFARQRTILLDAVDQALGDPNGAAHGRRIERFDVGPDHVVAYEAAITQSAFVRHLEFMISTDAPLVEPQSIMITDDANANLIAKQIGQKGEGAPIFIDRYSCQMHVTVGFAKTYAYDEAKAAVIKSLQAQPVAPAAKPFHACAWPQFVTPGLLR